MQVLRIKLTQNQAHYGRPEGVDNRMTYPLPPFSTVIGALHAACGYKEYHPMDISVQGRFQSMQKEVYTNHALLNRREDDRGLLIYLPHPDSLTAGYEGVAKALKPQGNSFKKNITIEVLSQKRMQEYWDLLRRREDLEEENTSLVKIKKQEWKDEEKALKAQMKELDKKSAAYQELAARIAQRKEEILMMEEEFRTRKEEQCEKPLRHYKTLAKGPKYCEVLYGIELLLHVSSDAKTLEEIENSIDNLTCIGRSEDFIHLEEIKRVELFSTIDGVYDNEIYGAYVKKAVLDQRSIYLGTGIGTGRTKVKGIPAKGTTFLLPKNYRLIDGKREFNYYKVCYISKYSIDEDSEDIFRDEDGYIVDLV